MLHDVITGQYKSNQTNKLRIVTRHHHEQLQRKAFDFYALDIYVCC